MRVGDITTGEKAVEEILDLLRSRCLSLSTAESCTGGLVGGMITSAPGSSDVYLGGGITYSNELKTALLGVSPALIEEHGAVSEACARAMAEGARTRFGSDLGVSVTGVAGPGGGTEDKPVGTVHFGLGTPSGTLHERHRFGRPREAVRRGAVRAALDMLRRWLRETP